MRHPTSNFFLTRIIFRDTQFSIRLCNGSIHRMVNSVLWNTPRTAQSKPSMMPPQRRRPLSHFRNIILSIAYSSVWMHYVMTRSSPSPTKMNKTSSFFVVIVVMKYYLPSTATETFPPKHISSSQTICYIQL